jgi:hypothetical protein
MGSHQAAITSKQPTTKLQATVQAETQLVHQAKCYNLTSALAMKLQGA